VNWTQTDAVTLAIVLALAWVGLVLCVLAILRAGAMADRALRQDDR
jgi:hypothetical protein